jgi:EAL domain-containing protein (putative c-di-GMP-specific phosphodiesterase class I)
MTPLLAPQPVLPDTPPPHQCKSCRLPSGPPADGILYLAPTQAEPLAHLKAYLGAAAVEFDEPQPGLLAVPFDRRRLDRLAADLPTTLSATEMTGTRALVVPAGRAAALTDFMNTRPLATVLAEVRSGWLAELLREDRLETHFQPIVSAADPASVFGYECLTRGRAGDGRLIPPGELFAAARAAEMLFPLDRAARLTAIRTAARKTVGERLFINFNPSSIYTPAFCLQTTFRAAEQHGFDPSRIVFEVVESEEVADAGHLLRILEVYRKAGFSVALDDVGAGYSSLNLLTRLKPDYVKLDMHLIRNVDADPYKAAVAGKLLEMAHSLGIKSVAEGVETAGEWRWVRDHGADYVQGYLFAKPAAEPPVPRVPV